MNKDNDLAISNFREYLQIPSVHPNVNYEPCVEFLRKQANSLNLPIRVYHCVPGKPIVIITWEGSDPKLPSVLLNSHMDVVPTSEECWTYPPFSAHVDQDGKIFARGSQDMKNVGIQYLEAVRRLKNDRVVLKRTVHILFVPDEEIGGRDGMESFVKTREFQNLNVGVHLDEGMANQNEEYWLFYGERILWHLEVHCRGDPGHGALLVPNTAGEKIRHVIDKFMDMRNEQLELLKNPNMLQGDVTSINLTKLGGGLQRNVIPDELYVVFDVRVNPNADLKALEEKMRRWCKEAGPDVELKFVQKDPLAANTTLDESNKFWTAFKEATDELGLVVKPIICPGTTDARFTRETGIPAFGFSPMANTPLLLHDHNEYMDSKVFLKGITIFKKIIENLANV